MKRTLTYILFLLGTILYCHALSVKDIPNVQVENRNLYLVNPDGIISSDTQARIDTLLAGVRSRTSAEISAVIIKDLDGEDPDDFATDLFEYWGIGKNDKDNGLLILISLNDRVATFRTGYGLEGVLPDVYLAKLFRDSLYTNMQNGNYDRGLESTLNGIVKVLDNPETLDEIRSSQKDNFGNHSDEDFSDFINAVWVWMITIFVLMTTIYAVARFSSRNKSKDATYAVADKISLASLMATFIGLGLPVIIYLLVKSWKNSIRSKAPLAADGKPMEKVSDQVAFNYLKPQAITETRIGSMTYDVWKDNATGATKVYGYHGPKYMQFSTCEKCGARAVQTYPPQTVRQATTLHSGEQVTNAVCMHCGNRTQKRTILPKIIPIVIGGGSGGGSGFGGGNFGGGFGGGSTGGGGFTGRW